MILFYTEHIQANEALFEGDELRHIQQALRKGVGEKINFTDGQGYLYEGVIIEQSKKRALVEWHDRKQVIPDYPEIHLAVAPTKNIDRTEWLLEKSIELGIAGFHLIQCKHSERKIVKIDRLERIATAAMKQSLKATRPLITELQDYESWLDQTTGSRYIATLHEQSVSLSQAISQDRNRSEMQHAAITVAVGPEGGFREDEVESAIQKGFRPVHLGTQRLRTETAGLFAVATIHSLHQLG